MAFFVRFLNRLRISLASRKAQTRGTSRSVARRIMFTYRGRPPGPHSTALLVIDVQQSFEHAPYWSPVDTPVFYDRLQSLIDGAQARQIPVVQIFHVEESGHFSLGSGFIRPLAALSIQPQAV